jgi:uncharacterized Zn finger protein
MSWRSDRQKPSSSKESGKGIKAHSKRGAFAENWWAQRWIGALEHVTDAGRLRRGQSYARKGQVLSIDEKAGVITARVQGSRPTPYKATIRLAPFTDAQWQAVIDGLAERAIFSAQLLAGEMPHEIEEAFSAVGLSLFPARQDELVTNCTCPDWANPCKHVAATHYILGEQFDEDPFLLFRLRGRSQEQIIAALRARRTAEVEAGGAEEVAGGATLAEPPAGYTVDAPSLEESLKQSSASFWQLGGSLEHFPTGIHPPAAPLAVLRRLGRPGFVEQDLEQLLGPFYDEASRRALALAFHDDETRTGESAEKEEQ